MHFWFLCQSVRACSQLLCWQSISWTVFVSPLLTPQSCLQPDKDLLLDATLLLWAQCQQQCSTLNELNELSVAQFLEDSHCYLVSDGWMYRVNSSCRNGSQIWQCKCAWVHAHSLYGCWCMCILPTPPWKNFNVLVLKSTVSDIVIVCRGLIFADTLHVKAPCNFQVCNRRLNWFLQTMV